MAKVFVSYSRKDIGFAKQLTAELQKCELDFWIDWEGIPPTVDWWKEIEKGIEESDAFLFLISPDSAKSRVCRQEIDVAVRNGKRLIPIVVRDIAWEDTPPNLGHLNYIFFREHDDFDAAVQKLLTAIHTDFEWTQTHRRLQVKALEWERNHKENSFLLRGKDLQDAEFQLATNTSKEPHPTDLQREYVFTSRQATDRQKRITTGIYLGGVIALAALAVFGFVKAGQATANEIKAVDNASTAQAVSTVAVANASTAQAASTLAVSNEQKAIREAEIALARQLAAQAQPLFANNNSRQQVAVLLAVQSMRLFPNVDAAQVLQNNTLAKSIVQINHESWVNVVAFSPDSKYVVTGSSDNTAQVWEVATGKEVTRVTHDDGVFAVAFSPDGRYVVSGSDDHTVHVWEALTGTEVSRMKHNDYVMSVAFSPDGKRVVSAGFDNTARVWDVATGIEIARMTHDRYVNAVAFSPNGQYVVSGSADNTARVWEASLGVEIARKTHFVRTVPIIGGGGGGRESGSGVAAVAFSPDGLYVVSGGCDERNAFSQCVRGSAFLWQSSTGEVVASMTHNDQVTSAAFSFDGRYVISGSQDNTARVWETATGEEISRMTHNGKVTAVGFSLNGEYAISGSDDETARVWDAATGKEITRMTHDWVVSSVAFSSDGEYAISGGYDHVAHIWNPVSGTQISRMPFGNNWMFSPDGRYMVATTCEAQDSKENCTQATVHAWEVSTGRETGRVTHQGTVLSLAISLDSQYLVSGSYDHTIRVLDLPTGQEIARMAHDDSVRSVAFSPDAAYIVSNSWDMTVRIWETATGKEITRKTYESSGGSAAFSPDGRYIASASQDFMQIWEASTGREIARMEDIFIDNILFSPDGKYILSSGSGSDIPIWETSTGKRVALMSHNGTITSAVFSPDGKLVLSAAGSTVRVWEAATGSEVARVIHDETAYSASFSPDGKYVVSGGCDISGEQFQCVQGSAQVWEVETGKEIARMTHPKGVFLVAFSPDGKYVISESPGDTLVWIYRPTDLIEQACSRVTRNLDLEEWQRYVGNAAYPSRQEDAPCPNAPIEVETLPTPTATP